MPKKTLNPKAKKEKNSSKFLLIITNLILDVVTISNL